MCISNDDYHTLLKGRRNKATETKISRIQFYEKAKRCYLLFTLVYGLWHILQHSVENTHALTFQLILLPCFSGAGDNVCSEPQNAVSLAVGTVKEDRGPKHMLIITTTALFTL